LAALFSIYLIWLLLFYLLWLLAYLRRTVHRHFEIGIRHDSIPVSNHWQSSHAYNIFLFHIITNLSWKFLLSFNYITLIFISNNKLVLIALTLFAFKIAQFNLIITCIIDNMISDNSFGFILFSSFEYNLIRIWRCCKGEDAF
jgi:hypothetical protein